MSQFIINSNDKLFSLVVLAGYIQGRFDIIYGTFIFQYHKWTYQLSFLEYKID